MEYTHADKDIPLKSDGANRRSNKKPSDPYPRTYGRSGAIVFDVSVRRNVNQRELNYIHSHDKYRKISPRTHLDN